MRDGAPLAGRRLRPTNSAAAAITSFHWLAGLVRIGASAPIQRPNGTAKSRSSTTGAVSSKHRRSVGNSRWGRRGSSLNQRFLAEPERLFYEEGRLSEEDALAGDLHDAAENVRDLTSFLLFLEVLASDWEAAARAEKTFPSGPYSTSTYGWENFTIGSFLEAPVAGARDNKIGSEGSIESSSAVWSQVARILLLGKLYE
jgi:hypothetical protein